MGRLELYRTIYKIIREKGLDMPEGYEPTEPYTPEPLKDEWREADEKRVQRARDALKAWHSKAVGVYEGDAIPGCVVGAIEGALEAGEDPDKVFSEEWDEFL